ncbi:MAG: hypothetical protein HOQ02_02770 [Lysobacter sp.]|nr:hypothetical protein [Lysobacter sp.]
MGGVLRPLRMLLSALALAGLAGCVHMTAPGYQPGVSNTEALLRSPGQKIAVEDFVAAPDVNDTGLSVRGSPLTAPRDGKFSTYLHDAAVRELATAGRYDAASPVRLSAILMRNDLDSGAAKGHAVLSARFVVARDGARVYDRPVQVQHDWDSSFVGAIAIPAAVDNYVAAVQKLLGRLFDDPAFVRATGTPATAAAAGTR